MFVTSSPRMRPNSAFAAGAVLSPAGDTALGSLALCSAVFAGATTYRVTIAPAPGDTVNDVITNTGALDLSNLTVMPSDSLSAAPTGSSYVILHADGGFTGAKPALSGFGSKWKLIRLGNDLILTSQGGLMMLLK